MSSFHIIPWYFLLLGVEMPAEKEFTSQHLIDSQAATLLILWEMAVLAARRDVT